MNTSNSIQGKKFAFAAPQSEMQPIGGPLQVEASLEALRGAVDFHVDMVLTLLRRLEPVAGEVFVDSLESGGTIKVPLALGIDVQIDRIANATRAVQAAIQALQI